MKELSSDDSDIPCDNRLSSSIEIKIYHLADMNTAILLVESQVILPTIYHVTSSYLQKKARYHVARSYLQRIVLYHVIIVAVDIK